MVENFPSDDPLFDALVKYMASGPSIAVPDVYEIYKDAIRQPGGKAYLENLFGEPAHRNSASHSLPAQSVVGEVFKTNNQATFTIKNSTASQQYSFTFEHSLEPGSGHIHGDLVLQKNARIHAGPVQITVHQVRGERLMFALSLDGQLLGMIDTEPVYFTWPTTEQPIVGAGEVSEL